MVFLLSLCIIIFINANFMQIDDNEKITVIDFPQMVSVSHRNAQMYVSYSDNKCDCVVYFFKNGFCICRFFDRDIECIYKFFNKRYARKLQLILGTEFFLLKFLFFLLGSILHQRKKKNKMDLKVMLKGIADHLFCL